MRCKLGGYGHEWIWMLCINCISINTYWAFAETKRNFFRRIINILFGWPSMMKTKTMCICCVCANQFFFRFVSICNFFLICFWMAKMELGQYVYCMIFVYIVCRLPNEYKVCTHIIRSNKTKTTITSRNCIQKRSVIGLWGMRDVAIIIHTYWVFVTVDEERFTACVVVIVVKLTTPWYRVCVWFLSKQKVSAIWERYYRCDSIIDPLEKKIKIGLYSTWTHTHTATRARAT